MSEHYLKLRDKIERNLNGLCENEYKYRKSDMTPARKKIILDSFDTMQEDIVRDITAIIDHSERMSKAIKVIQTEIENKGGHVADYWDFSFEKYYNFPETMNRVEIHIYNCWDSFDVYIWDTSDEVLPYI